MMWTLSGKREVFLEVVSGISGGRTLNLRPVETHVDLLPRPGDLSFVWDQPPLGPADLPQIIIGDEASLEDLVAWAGSYISGLGTISSNCRLILRSEISLLSTRESSGARLHANVLAGMVMAEVLAMSDSAKGVADLTITACLSTCAFACARAQFLSHPPTARKSLAERWERAHRVTNPSSGVSSEVLHSVMQTCDHILEFAAKGMHGANGPTFIDGALARLARDREITPGLLYDVLRAFERDGVEIRDFRSIFDLTPTDRVKVFDDLAPVLRSDSGRPRMERSFALAMLASACRPGTLQHFALLRSPHEAMSDALLWFGAIQGLHRQNDILETGEGLGRRILRELFQKESIADRPRSDVALLELDILVRGNSLRSLRTNNSSLISVEIAPGVYTLAKWRPLASERKEEASGELALQPDRDPLQELAVTIQNASNLLSEIRRQEVRSRAKDETRRGKRWRR
jgi:hypothetical protein